MGKSSFTIITPVFNRADCIQRCIKSVINQCYTNLEYWIVDDGSTDGTRGIVESYAKQYPFIRFHQFYKNQGVNAARNYAIQRSTKQYIIFLDSDDYFVENALETIDQTVSIHPIYQHYLFAQDDRMEYYNRNDLLKNQNQELSFFDFLAGKVSGDFLHVIATPLLQSFPFNESLRTYEILTFLQIFKAGKKQYFTKKVLVKRERGRSDSVSKEYHLKNEIALYNQYISLKEILSLFEEDYKQLQNQNILSNLIKRIFILGLALGKYQENELLKGKIKTLSIQIPVAIRLIDQFHLDFLLRKSIFVYSLIKNLVFKNK